jgi:hypothetical protein
VGKRPARYGSSESDGLMALYYSFFVNVRRPLGQYHGVDNLWSFGRGNENGH